MGTPQLRAPHPSRNPAATVLCPSLVRAVCNRLSRLCGPSPTGRSTGSAELGDRRLRPVETRAQGPTNGHSTTMRIVGRKHKASRKWIFTGTVAALLRMRWGRLSRVSFAGACNTRHWEAKRIGL